MRMIQLKINFQLYVQYILIVCGEFDHLWIVRIGHIVTVVHVVALQIHKYYARSCNIFFSNQFAISRFSNFDFLASFRRWPHVFFFFFSITISRQAHTVWLDAENERNEMSRKPFVFIFFFSWLLPNANSKSHQNYLQNSFRKIRFPFDSIISWIISRTSLLIPIANVVSLTLEVFFPSVFHSLRAPIALFIIITDSSHYFPLSRQIIIVVRVHWLIFMISWYIC